MKFTLLCFRLLKRILTLFDCNEKFAYDHIKWTQIIYMRQSFSYSHTICPLYIVKHSFTQSSTSFNHPILCSSTNYSCFASYSFIY
jgi:hypothetical protein